MTSLGWLIVAVTVLVPALVLLEGARQRRRHGRPSGRPGLAGAGMLELQRHLQPDRKVDVLLEERDDEERDEAGDPRRPGPTPRSRA